MPKKKRTRQEGEQIVAEYHKSGLSQKKFAKQRGITYSALQYWIKVLRDSQDGDRKQKTGVQFVQVLEQEPQSDRASVTLEIHGIAAIRFNQLPEPGYLAELVHQINR